MECPYISSFFEEKVWERFLYGLKSSRTKKIYENIILDICNTCKRDFIDIDVSCVNQYRSVLQERGLADSTVDLYMRILRSISNFILENGLVSGYKNPFIYLPYSSNAGFYENIEIPTIEEVSAILQTARTLESGNAFLAITLTFRACLAPSELLNLQRKHFHFPKSQSLDIISESERRTILLPDDVLECISAIDSDFFFSNDPDLYLFRKKNGTPITLRTLQYSVKHAAELSNTNITLQKLRNLGILELLRVNTDRKSVAAYAGLSGYWLFRYEKCLMERELQDINLPHIKIEP